MHISASSCDQILLLQDFARFHSSLCTCTYILVEACFWDISSCCYDKRLGHFQAKELGRIIFEQEENIDSLQKELKDVTAQLNHTRCSLEDQIAELEVSCTL